MPPRFSSPCLEIFRYRKYVALLIPIFPMISDIGCPSPRSLSNNARRSRISLFIFFLPAPRALCTCPEFFWQILNSFCSSLILFSRFSKTSLSCAIFPCNFSIFFFHVHPVFCTMLIFRNTNKILFICLFFNETFVVNVNLSGFLIED